MSSARVLSDSEIEVILLMQKINSRGPITDPWGTPKETGKRWDGAPLTQTY